MKSKNSRTIETNLFKFQKQALLAQNLELPFTEHIEELRQRCLHVGLGVLIITLLAFIDVKQIVQILEKPVQSIRFFQLSPGEYFLSTVKIAFYIGILFTSPVILNQLTLFIIPGLNKNEKQIILPLLIGSTSLFFVSLGFSYFYLIPAALNFFINYSADIIEPLWSFNQYFDFILVLFYTTGIAFQIPIFQVILGLLNVINGKEMLRLWRYVILFATIVGAVLTPSTDPVTQLLLSGAILFLYFLGAIIVIAIKN